MRHDHLIDLIYGSVGDLASWPQVIDAVRDALKADVAVQLFSNATATNIAETEVAGLNTIIGISSEDALHIAENVPFSPVATRASSLRQGKVNLVYEIVPEREFMRSSFFERCIDPAHLTDAIFACLSPPGPDMATLHLMRTDGRFVLGDAGMRNAADALLGHLSKAFLVNRKLVDIRLDRAGLYGDVTDKIGVGILVVDRDGVCLWANPFAERLLAQGDGLALTAGKKVTPVHQSMFARWKTLLDGMYLCRPGAASIERVSAKLPYSLITLPSDRAYPQSSHGYFRASKAIGTVIVHDHHAANIGKDGGELGNRLAALFALTPAQARVAIAVGQGGGLAAASKTLGISVATVKTHLNQVFQKMAITSQGELVGQLQRIALI